MLYALYILLKSTNALPTSTVSRIIAGVSYPSEIVIHYYLFPEYLIQK